MVFYEAPHKLAATLSDLLDTLGDRRVAVVRELTKLHEEAFRTTLSGALERFADGSARGEIVLVVEGASAAPKGEPDPALALQRARALLEEGRSAAEAAKQAARETGAKRSAIYRQLVHDGPEAE